MQTCVHGITAGRVFSSSGFFLRKRSRGWRGVGGGSTCYVREYFSLCPLQSPEERKLLPFQIKAQLSDNGPPSAGILIGLFWGLLKVLVHYFQRPFSSDFLIRKVNCRVSQSHFKHMPAKSHPVGILFSLWNKVPQRRLTLVLLRVLDILLFRKLKVRLTLYFSDSTLDGIMYLSHSSSSILYDMIYAKGTHSHMVSELPLHWNLTCISFAMKWAIILVL